MKKKWVIGGLLVFVAVVIVPAVINALYLVNGGYTTVWSGADMLAFYGAALGSVGTIVLGIVAWAQNKRLLKLEETKYTLEIQPFIMLVAWKTPMRKSFDFQEDTVQIAIANPNEANMALELRFSNTTNAFLTAEFVKIDYADGQDSVGWHIGYIGAVNRKLVLQPNASGVISFIGTFDEFKITCGKKKTRFTFILENRFGDKFTETFEAIVTLVKYTYVGDRVICNAKIVCDNYRVEKYQGENDEL